MKMVMVIIVAAFPLMMHAQGFFAQKKTKLKYIAQQIALLKLYGGYVKKGYGIAKDGLKVIDDIKHSDFDLHNNYFNSLTKVNSAVKDYARQDSIENIKEEISAVNDRIKKFTLDNDYLQAKEKAYISKVMLNLMDVCNNNLQQFNVFTNDTAFALTDDERLMRINALFADMRDQYAFAMYFESSVKMLAFSRAKEANDLKTVKQIHEPK